MAFKLVVFFVGVIAVVAADSLKPAFWKGTALDAHVEKIRSSCAEDDTIACFQYKAISFLDNVLKGDYFHLAGNTELRRNSYPSNEISGRSDNGIEHAVEDFVKTHDVSVKIPGVGAVTVDSTALDKDEIDLKLDFGSETATEERGKKSKLKKIFIPIIVFLLLKAITLVPFVLGILGLKAWNGLQLSFFSFIISAGLAIFQLCQKLAADSAHAHPHVSAAGPWESAPVHYGRSFDGAQQMAYSGYVQN